MSKQLASGLTLTLKRRDSTKSTNDNAPIPNAGSSGAVEKSDAPVANRMPATRRSRALQLTLKNQASIATDLRTSLQEQLQRQTYECMVCFDSVKTSDRIWNCETCYAIFHYKCASKWAKKSVGVGVDDGSLSSWRCPGCQSTTANAPANDTCFCGKMIHPPFNRLTYPHSCGQSCNKARKCPHKCDLPCHPGPCPPCTDRYTLVNCLCGETKQNVKCTALEAEISAMCTKICKKLLNCGKHTCLSICHDGSCGPCEQNVENTCYCGMERREQVCGTSRSSFSCENPCAFKYDCGIHGCLTKCHAEKHLRKACPYSSKAIISCCCGAVKEGIGLKMRKCSDPLPVCGNNCQKLLRCGHRCINTCHPGDWYTFFNTSPPCLLDRTMTCRCGKSTLNIICSLSDGSIEQPECNLLCNKKLSCKRHKCDRNCCVEEFHECSRTCNKSLSCGKHRCMDSCNHRGKCHACVEGVNFEESFCACGKTIIYPPIPCNAPPPKCKFLCRLRHECGHATLNKHLCHPNTEPCPPCMVFVTRSCSCGSRLFPNIPCSRLSSQSCGTVCKSIIPGCEHACARTCHSNACKDENNPCKSKCGYKRALCGHQCLNPCNGTSACTQEHPCVSMETFHCSCGSKVEKRVCGTSITNPPTALILECDESCDHNLRKVKMAEAFKIGEDPILEPLCEVWSESVIQLGRDLEKLVKSTEKTLSSLVADQSVTFYYFPRQKSSSSNSLIYEMCLVYGFASEIVDTNIGKGTMIARRSALKMPSLPMSLLSGEIAATAGLVILVDSDTTEAVDTTEMQEDLNATTYKSNALHVTNVPSDQSTSEVLEILVGHFSNLDIHGQLFWLDEWTFYIVVNDSIEDQDSYLDKVYFSLLESQAAIWQLKYCQSFKAGFMRFAREKLFSIKRLIVPTWRYETLDNDGWIKKTTRSRGFDISSPKFQAKDTSMQANLRSTKNVFDVLS